MIRCIRMALALGLALISRARADDTLPFTISLDEIIGTGAPALQAFSSAVTSTGQWLCLGGRTAGLHGRQDAGDTPPPAANFTGWNDQICVIDPIRKITIRRPLANVVPRAMLPSLQVTGAQSTQLGDKLVIVGGYGFDKTHTFMLTYSIVTVLDVNAVTRAVTAGALAGEHIRQSKPDPAFQVTGGGLICIDGMYYLALGQNFAGFYTPQSNGEYTFQTRVFRLTDEGGAVRFIHQAPLIAAERAPFRRRDGNLAPLQSKTGERSAVFFGGVFTETNGPWREPIAIAPGRMSVLQTFKQQMCQYSCATLPVFQASTGTMTTLFFGGISEVSYSTGEFVRDPSLPFVRDIGAVVVDQDGRWRELVVGQGAGNPPKPLLLPALLGASAAFLPAHGAPFDRGVLLLDKIQRTSTVGFIYGGIAATQPNNGPTQASARIFAVRLQPQPAPAIPVKIGG